MSDFLELKQRLMGDIKKVVWDINPNGRFEGNEYIALNPRRPDTTLGSFKFNCESGAWSDFASGDKGGDIIDYYCHCKSVTAKEALKELGAFSSHIEARPIKEREKIVIDESKKPTKPDFKDSDIQYKYSDRFYILRWNSTEHDKKRFQPLTWTSKGWKLKAPEKRPFYGLDTITEDSCFIVEGEKCADAIKEKTGLPVLSICGGSNAISKADWGSFPKQIKNIIFIPDNDEAGVKYCVEIRRMLPDVNARIVSWGERQPKYDIADFFADGYTVDEFFQLAQDSEEFKINEDVAYQDEHDIIYQEQDQEQEPIIENYDSHDSIEKPWISLGYNKGLYYFYSKATKQIIELTPSHINEASLLQFAPLGFWNEHFLNKKQIDWGSARNLLITECNAFGVYDMSKVRGSGVWLDNGRVVVHAGNYLSINGQKTSLKDYSGNYVYEASKQSYSAIDEKPLTLPEANKLAKLIEQLTFTEQSKMEKYLLGWMPCAIISGALSWRPHIFVTGGAGTGKSTVVNQIVTKIIGNESILAIGSSTGAGIRQAEGNKRWPVIWDEFEVENKRDSQRADDILGMIRGASSDSEAKVIKGSQTGEAKFYDVASCFLMSGINISLHKRADETRFSIIELAPHKSKVDTISPQIVHLITDDFCKKFRARVLSMAGIIIENARIFRIAVSEKIGARLGDQIGTLLAGAYSCYSDGIISIEKAREWVEKNTWDDENLIMGDREECRMMGHILTSIVDVGGGKKRTISSLLHASRSVYEINEHDVNPKEAKSSLERMGFKSDDDGVWLSINSQSINNLLTETPWCSGYSHHLSRLTGSKNTKPIWIGGTTQRSKFISWELLEDFIGSKSEKPENDNWDGFEII